ncbi:MAG: glycosyltransferase [Bacteriovorax sp.]|nr:glycosyltransferase [Bacteriovorax sp.]
MNRCLWVVPKGIFPIKDGARVANASLLKAIRPNFNEMDIVIFNEDDSDEFFLQSYQSEFNFSNIYFLKRKSFKNIIMKVVFLGISFLKSFSLPVTTGYYHTTSLSKKVQKILQTKQYDVIVFDGLHPYTAFMDLPEIKNIPLIYRAHNVEGDLWTTAAEKKSNIVFKKLLKWQGRKMIKLEYDLLSRVNKVWNISAEDLFRCKSFFKENLSKFVLIPVGLDFKKIEKKVSDHQNIKMKLLFLGKLDWAPNKDGLKWFLEDVWPHIDHQKFELHIVGSGDSSWGTLLFKMPGIHFHGFVENVDEAYANCDFSIIPILYGSGTRIKVIESISKGIPIISTKMGVQGSELQDYLEATSADEWIKTISCVDIESANIMAQKAFTHLEKMYSLKDIADKAYASIKDN